MAKTQILDELIVTLRVPSGMPEDRIEMIRRTLNARGFLTRLRRAIHTELGSKPALASLRVSVTR